MLPEQFILAQLGAERRGAFFELDSSDAGKKVADLSGTAVGAGIFVGKEPLTKIFGLADVDDSTGGIEHPIYTGVLGRRRKKSAPILSANGFGSGNNFIC